MELALDVATAVCRHCGAINIFPGFTDYNHELKNLFKSAATQAGTLKDDPFGEFYQNLVAAYAACSNRNRAILPFR
jgi:hypothetical protein